MSVPEKLPALVREYYRSTFKLEYFDIATRTLCGIKCPFVLDEHVVYADFAAHSSMERMMSAFTRFGQVEAAILLSATGIGVITPTKFFVYNPIHRSVSLEWDRVPAVYPPNLLEVGYEKTFVLTPRVFQPVSKVLFDRDTWRIYTLGEWRDFPHRETPQLCSDINLYHELIRRNKDYVVMLESVGPLFVNI